MQTVALIEKYWLNNKAKFEKTTEELDYLACGVWYTEGFLLCSIFDLLKVDLILESGTAYGQSTELMAKYSNKQIITVDSDAMYGQYENTSNRLKKYKNVSCKQGDSFEVLPKLIRENNDKKVGIFIDGPKDAVALKLGGLLLQYSNVVCVMYHDMFINTTVSGEKLDTHCKGSLGFINKDYGYLNDKVLEASGEQKRYLPNGPGVFVQIK